MLAACDRCAKEFDVTGKRAGAGFRCPSCKQGTIRVPAGEVDDLVELDAEEIDLEEIAPAGAARPTPASRSHAARGASARPGRGSRTARAGTAGRPGSSKPLLIGLGALAIAGVTAFVLVGGGKDEPAKAPDATKAADGVNGAAPKPATPTPPAAVDPRKVYAERLAALEKKDAAGRVELAAFCDSSGLRTEARQLRREALLLDSDSEPARLALGFQKYAGPVAHLQGRWLDSVDLERAKQLEPLYGMAAGGDAGLSRAATPYDVFLRNCEDWKHKMIGEFTADRWLYAYGKELMPQPFFVLIERPGGDAALEAYRAEYAEILGTLYEAFMGRYEKRFNLERDIERPIRVIMFDSVETYAAHRANHPDRGYADPEFIGGYYSPGEQRLIMWRGGMDIRGVLFHEGTHMFVHYAFSGKGFTPSRQTPWLQEGIAEFFAGHKIEQEEVDGQKRRKFVLGRFLPGRYGNYRGLLSVGAIYPVHELVKIDNYAFEKAKTDQSAGGDEGGAAQILVQQVYASGWVFCMYLNNAEGGKWANVFDDYLEAETKGEGYWQKLGELMGLKSDDDWAELDQKVRDWAVNELPKLK